MAQLSRTSTFNRQRQTLEQTHLLCVEPGTKQLFSINMGTQTAEEVVLENQQKITNKIKREEYKMDQLLDRRTHYSKWFFQNETSQSFRRQMVPFYLLEMEANLYPVYVDNSNIDDSLTNDFKIHEIQIKLSDSIWQTINTQDNANQGRGSEANPSKMTLMVNKQPESRAGTIQPALQSRQMLINDNYMQRGAEPTNNIGQRPVSAALSNGFYEFTSFKLKDVSLLTTADKVIKKCEKEIENMLKNKFSFRDVQHKMQILKFKSEDSYAYGETQLIYFVEIREYLRARAKDDKKILELVLISLGADEMNADNTHGKSKASFLRQKTSMMTETQTQSHQFPPLIEQKPLGGGGGGGGMSARHQTMAHIDSDQRQKTMAKKQATMKHARANPQNQIAQRYKNVSIFGWYTPLNFVPKSSENSHRFPSFSDMLSGASSMFEPSMQASAQYSVGEKFRISSEKQDHGHISFLKQPDRGLIPYTAETEILKSCDIHFPLKINLLALRDLAERLKDKAFNTNKATAKLMRKISYVAPYEPQNNDVMNLLAQCQALSGNNTDRGSLRKNLVNPFGNQSINKNCSQGFQEMKFKILKPKPKPPNKRTDKDYKFFSFKPQYVQIQAALYLGCRRISTFSYSRPQLYGNEIDFSGEFLQFYKPEQKQRPLKQRELNEEMMTPEVSNEVLKISCLPSCARLCFNVILLPEPGSCAVIKADKQILHKVEENQNTLSKVKFVQREGLVLGSCQVSLFDESFLIRQGRRECRLWHFQSFQPRMVCQGECYRKKNANSVYNPNAIAQCMTIQIEFQSFAGKIGWRLQKQDSRKNDRFSNNQYGVGNQKPPNMNYNSHQMSRSKQTGDLANQKTTFENVDLEQETKSLKQVKRLLDAYPMDLDEEDEDDMIVDKVLEYRNYIHKMPIFIRLIDFTDHEKIGICYDTLGESGLAKDMLPEESLALLDGQFGDIKVRIFAVKKLSMLNDSQIALFMPQLIQALKYELFHHSPLAEFLLEKALKNTRVVGHAFYWALKANLHWKASRERFFLILERFLMCCGQFKNDFLKQVYVNRSLVTISGKVNEQLDNEGASKSFAKGFMHKELKREEIKIKLMQQLVIAHAKYDDIDFKPDGTRHTQNSIQDIEQVDSLGMDSRRHSGKGSSSGEDKGPGSRRASNKFIRSDGSAQQEKYCFDEKAIEDFVQKRTDDIMNSIRFKMDEEDDDDGLGDNRRSQYKLSPRTQAKDQALNRFFYNHWKVEWQSELLYLPFAPKNPLSSFSDDGGAIFMSAKKPLLISYVLANEKETEASLSAQNSQGLDYNKHDSFQENERSYRWEPNFDDKDQQAEKKKFIYKCGDDLRQDNLVLQFFKIMDRLWQSSGDDLRMICYDVMETGDQTGFIEFIDNAQTITAMHQEDGGYRGPLREKSIMNYFLKNVGNNKDEFREFSVAKDSKTIKQKLNDYNETYLHSLAGQCVATYVLGIRDRHPGNYMLHKPTGTFFHIDFGHFLGWGKKKIGFLRDREPFILSNEMHYFLKNFCQIDCRPIVNDGTLSKNSMLKSSGYKSSKGRSDHSELSNGQGIEEQKNAVSSNDIAYNIAVSALVGDQLAPEEVKEAPQPEKEFELFFSPQTENERKDRSGGQNQRKKRFTPDYFEEAFEKLASQAFLKIRQNADIFINLLVLMLVAGLDELDQPHITFVKKALFLSVSEEEATVSFKHTIDQARKQWYRPIDNIFHVYMDKKKDAKLKKREIKALAAKGKKGKKGKK